MDEKAELRLAAATAAEAAVSQAMARLAQQLGVEMLYVAFAIEVTPTPDRDLEAGGELFLGTNVGRKEVMVTLMQLVAEMIYNSPERPHKPVVN